MSWIKEVEAINKRRELASQQGGEESVARHHANGNSACLGDSQRSPRFFNETLMIWKG